MWYFLRECLAKIYDLMDILFFIEEENGILSFWKQRNNGKRPIGYQKFKTKKYKGCVF